MLVLGTVPPPGGSYEREFARFAAQLVNEGHEVEIVSPDPRSASHRHTRLDRFRLLWQVVLASRRCQGLVLRIQPSLPLPAGTGRLKRAAVMGLLGLLATRFERVIIRIDDGIPLPGGLGGRALAGLWAKAETILVGREEDLDRLVAVPGIRPEQVVLSPIPPLPIRARSEDWAVGGVDPRPDILAHVRVRAAETRRLAAAGRVLAAAGVAGSAQIDQLDDGRSPLLAEGTATLESRTLLRYIYGTTRNRTRHVLHRLRLL